MGADLRTTLVEPAPAKVNLSLGVLGRRADGYHELESLVVFAAIGDRLELVPGTEVSLRIDGAGDLSAGDDNLVMRAARGFAEMFPGTRSGAFRLEKRLPVASGIGGGSADAAAALRLLARLNGLPTDLPALFSLARRLGADVPVCLSGRACVMRGAGENLGAPLSPPSLPCLLVNPRVAVSTAAVFATLGLKPGDVVPGPGLIGPGALASHWSFEVLLQLRNDLEPPALKVAPIIGEVLARLRQSSGARLVRMSGSGATCFALYGSAADAAVAAARLRDERPDWWVEATQLG